MQAHVDPQGTRVAFWGAERGEPRLWLADTAGSAPPEPIGPEGGRHPVFDPSGRRLAFCLTEGADPIEAMGSRASSGIPARGAVSNIFVLDIASAQLSQLTDGPSQDQRPCWSPDGTVVVYVSDGRLKRVVVDGGIPEEIADSPLAYRPWFSLDGQELFFFSAATAEHRVQRMPAKGGLPVALPNDDRGQTHGPFADPTGDHLLVHSNREGRWWIFEFPLDGGPPRRVHLDGVDSAGHGTRSLTGVLAFDGS